MSEEDRAFAAAWKIVSAWDGKITKPVLRKAIDAAISEARTEALEEAEKAVRNCLDPSIFVITGPAGIIRQAVGAIRSLIQKQKEG
ncbi:hypothetical protein HJB79_18000 [Rhizobium lentis]|uniref:hypothetical protein n=1 Tax=Rhizobium lentis TaxID=1138194 RepID=UPI001C83CCE7|nr:hypothetical protein [Rhizobium lentis]MBX5140648.1 hypothetical protein [Rhizobium lentis]